MPTPPTIDFLILSHAHADHIRGAKKLVKTLNVGHIFVGTTSSNNAKKYTELKGVADQRGTSMTVIGHDKMARFQHKDLDALAWGAPASVAKATASDNEHSLFIEIHFRNRLIIFTGDGERKLQQEWANVADGLDNFDYYKVAHHGANNGVSREFWTGRHCRESTGVAVVSTSGTHPVYKHPHAPALKFYQKHGCTIVRTDMDGHYLWRVVAKGNIVTRHNAVLGLIGGDEADETTED